MKKILSILMLVALVVSCSSDDTEPNNGKDDNKGMIDEKILGKWKVEYSKTIKGARFLEDGTLEIADNAVITEYMGNFGEPDVVPNSGMFHHREHKIEIKKDNKINSTIAENNPLQIVDYKIEDGLLKWQTAKDNPTGINKYYFEDDNLVMELIGSKGTAYPINYYTISKYSKIKE